MDTKTILSISEARKKIFQIAEEVQKLSNHYILTHRGKPKIAIMSAKQLESWQETLDVVSNFPNLEKDIKKAEKEYEQNDYSTLKDILLKEGFILDNKIKG